MQILCDRRALHILEYALEKLMLHRMPMLHGPTYRQRMMVVGEALRSKLMFPVLINFQVNVDVLHAWRTPIARPDVKTCCFSPVLLFPMRLTASQRTQRSLQFITFVKAAMHPSSVQLSSSLAYRSCVCRIRMYFARGWNTGWLVQDHLVARG